MRKVASIYVDHQDEIHYPVPFICRNLDMFDRIYLFSSDSINASLLEAEMKSHPLSNKVSVISIGVKIEDPSHIATAQNRCVEWLRENDGFDYVFVLQADTTVTKSGCRVLEDWFASEDVGRPPLMMKLRVITVHVESCRSYFGAAIIGRKSGRSKFVGDGAHTEGYWISTDQDHVWHTIDVGKASVEAFKNKISRHTKTWHHSTALLDSTLRLYTEDRKEFIRTLLRNVRLTHAVELDRTPDDAYEDFLDWFSLRAEREEVGAIIAEPEFQGP